MRRFETTVDIAAPPERVWQVMRDITRWHEWTPSVTSVKILGDAAFAVSSRVMIRQPRLPPALWTITEIQPGRAFSWVSVAPGLRVVGTHLVEPAAGGSRAVLSIDMEGALGGLWGRLTKSITERYIAFEAAGLKVRSEHADYRHHEG
jgi:uncharacterized membrane protein